MHGQPADGVGLGVLLAHRWLCNAPPQALHSHGRLPALSGRHGREPPPPRPTNGFWLGSRAGQTGKATRRERITRVCSGRPPGMAQRRTNGHRGLGQHRYGDVTGITGSRSSIEQCRHFAGRDHPVDYPTRATDRNRGRGPRPRSAARRRGPESAKEVTVAAGEPTPTAGGVVPPEKSIATFWTHRHSRRFTSLRLLPPASRVFAVCRIAPTDGLPLPAPQGRRSGAGVMGQAAGWGGGGRRWWSLR
jgi:hypothetical protein